MPARKSARRTQTKSFKKCSKRSRNACRKSSRCSYRADRSPKCQPKRSRRASRRASRRRSAKRAAPRSRKAADSNLGALMTEGELINRVRKARCANEPRFGKECDEGCSYDRRMGCVPTVLLEDKTGRFLSDGSRNVTFRSNKKPAFSFKMPVNIDTVCGDYAGAIRFSPVTGKLVLCYGPLIQGVTRSERPLISTIVRENIAKNLWQWYQSTGRHIQRKRVEEMVAPDGSYYYADIYGLPGASIQLSWQEANWLDHFLGHKFEQWKKSEASKGVMLGDDAKEKYKLPTNLQDLSKPPSSCPAFLEKQDIVNIDDTRNCFAVNEPGNLRDLSDKRRKILEDAETAAGTAGNDLRKSRIHERLSDFDPFLSSSMNRRELLRKRYNITPELLGQYGIDLDEFEDDDDIEEIYALYERKRRDYRREQKRRAEVSTRLSSPSFGFEPTKMDAVDGTRLAHYDVYNEERKSEARRVQSYRSETNFDRAKNELVKQVGKMTKLPDDGLMNALYERAAPASVTPYDFTSASTFPKVQEFEALMEQTNAPLTAFKDIHDALKDAIAKNTWLDDLKAYRTTGPRLMAVVNQYYEVLKALYQSKLDDQALGSLEARGFKFSSNRMPRLIAPVATPPAPAPAPIGRAESRIRTRNQRYRGSNSSSEDDDDDSDSD